MPAADVAPERCTPRPRRAGLRGVHGRIRGRAETERERERPRRIADLRRLDDVPVGRRAVVELQVVVGVELGETITWRSDEAARLAGESMVGGERADDLGGPGTARRCRV